MASAGYCSMGKIMWETPYAEAVVCVVAYCFGVN